MKKLLLGTALSFVLIAPSWAEDLPYSQQRSVSQADVATLAPASGQEAAKPEVAPVPEPTHEKAHWDYGPGQAGPHEWSKIEPQFLLCGTGRKQSPVNIAKFYQEDLPVIEPRYGSVPLSVVNNGHTLQFNYAPGSGFVVDGLGYRLKQFHFHTPSEHYIDGAPYPMELHFVHQSDDGSLAVIGVMIKAGAHNKFIEALWQNAPLNAGGEKTIADVQLSAADLMPKALDYYRYDGSLTTPPCSEGVQWMVLKEPIEISEEQIKTFQKLFPMNARPVQPLGERAITGD
jgi:carbonic anhydrase